MPTSPHQADLAALESQGFFLAPRVIDQQRIAKLIAAVADVATTRATSRNARRLLETCPAVTELARSSAVRNLVESVLGSQAFAVRGLLFDKAAGANWHVGWHQDLMIPVAHRIETPGFDAWSVKQGVPHVRPPAAVLQRMLTLRVHLDDCPADNGPLMVLPGTHHLGRIAEKEVRQVASEYEATVCTAHAGDVLAMRPLLLHASQPAQAPGHRRVVHLEFAGEGLPGGLRWWGSTATTMPSPSPRRG